MKEFFNPANHPWEKTSHVTRTRKSSFILVKLSNGYIMNELCGKREPSKHTFENSHNLISKQISPSDSNRSSVTDDHRGTIYILIASFLFTRFPKCVDSITHVFINSIYSYLCPKGSFGTQVLTLFHNVCLFPGDIPFVVPCWDMSI